MDLPAADIHAAAERLRGQVVHTPVIGDVLLRLKDPAGGEASVMSCPRLKAECLQTGGTIEYRGAQHFLLRQLGASKGVVIGGRDHRVLGCVRAGQSHRLPMLGIVVEPATAPRLDLIRACGCELEAVPREELSRKVRDAVAATGFTLMPHAENMDFALGIATAGLELGVELSADITSVYVSPAILAPAITAGLRAGGHDANVVGVDPDGMPVAHVSVALAHSANLNSEVAGALALKQALADGVTEQACVILSC